MANRQPTVEELNNVKQSTVQWAESAHRVFNVQSLVNTSYDAVTVAYPDSSTEIYSFRDTDVSGTVKATVTVIYTDSSKDLLTSVVRS